MKLALAHLTVTVMTFLPANALGADLLWWRTSNGMRSTVTLLWCECQEFADVVHLEALLFDASGDQVAAWRISVNPGVPVFVDSAADGPWRLAQGSDGMLALYACTDVRPSAKARETFRRLFPIMDWRASDGRLVTLHSDQAVRRGQAALQQFTEIVVVEAVDENNALVLLNGEESQPEDSLEITVTNSAGVSRLAKYALPMQPFTVHRIPLASVFPDLLVFCGGYPLLVCGTFASRGLFSRPYVETTGQRWGAYHAGNHYAWAPLPHFAHALIAGEVNPIAVLHSGQTRTLVNLLHSHGDVEDDMWVSAALFDTRGNCVAQRTAWRLVPRDGLARFDIAELLPEPTAPFRGHIALTYAAEPGRAVPRRLQALVEYRRPDSVARTMTWSDEWNSKVRIAKRDRCATPPRGRSYFRICEDGEVTTEVSITNAGHAGHERVAEVRLVLYGGDGPLAECSLRILPFATRVVTIEQLFPDLPAALGPSGLGMLLIESASDLANVAFTHHRQTGAVGAEHFISLPMHYDGRIEWPPGA